jgi:archaeal cell division control protein 6
MMRRLLEDALGRSVVKNHQPLSFDYVPKELPHREEQFKQLSAIFAPLVSTGLAQHARFKGPVGSGKTVTAKRFIEEARGVARDKGRSLDFVHVNCRRRDSESAVLLYIIRKFDAGFPDRGFSVSEMLNILHKHLQMKAVNLIIVLDEADVLLKRQKVDLVYQLTRFNEEGGQNWNVSLLLISQHDLAPLLDEASNSTLKATTLIDFKRYSAPELADILRQRVELAFHPATVSEEVIREIASIAAKKRGDARHAIDLLAGAAGLADTRKVDTVTVEHVRNTNANTYATVERDKIDDLSRQHKLVLLAAARALKKKTQVTSTELHKVYSVVCEEHEEEARKSTQFWKYLNELESRGLLELEKGKDGTSGQTLVALQEVEAEFLQEWVEEALAEDKHAGENPW